eukprot:3600895-Prymnesium_polylepis.1
MQRRDRPGPVRANSVEFRPNRIRPNSAEFDRIRSNPQDRAWRAAEQWRRVVVTVYVHRK